MTVHDHYCIELYISRFSCSNYVNKKPNILRLSKREGFVVRFLFLSSYFLPPLRIPLPELLEAVIYPRNSVGEIIY